MHGNVFLEKREVIIICLQMELQLLKWLKSYQIKYGPGEELTGDDLNSMGVKAIDDYTLEEIKTTVRVPFFDELMAFPCFFPINEKFAEKQGNKYGKNAKTILGNGAFIMTNWEPGSIAEFKKNEVTMKQKL